MNSIGQGYAGSVGNLPTFYKPGGNNGAMEYAMPWNWLTIGLDKLGIFGDSSPDQGNPYGGMAPYPTYVGMEPDQTQISGQFMGANAPLNKFAAESMRTGPSAGTQFALNQNRIGANASRGQAVAMAQGGAKNAAADLSMRGGLGAGANERIQTRPTRTRAGTAQT